MAGIDGEGRGIRWPDVAEDFAFDGALRDVYVFDTTADDWQAVWRAVVERYPIQAGDGGAVPLDVRPLLGGERRRMMVDPDGIRANCHFFCEGQVEFDVDPRDFTGQLAMEGLCEFIAMVGRAAGKDAVLTMENAPECVSLRYDVQSGTITRGPGLGNA